MTAMTHTNRTDLAGQNIGNWRLLRLLGEGAFGAVYEAEHHAIAGRRAAVKVMDAQSVLQPDQNRRFVNEASAASRIAHEHIVQVFDGGVTESGVCYVVMELLSGQSLAQVLLRGRWNVGRTVNLGLQAASALQAAHNIGIVHRDLKPDNMYIVPRDHNPEFLKILDFGIAKLRDAQGETKAGIWLGTPGYMSPEQWQTIPDIDGRADIYSLGVILYECLTGQLPFSGRTPYDWLNAHLTHPVPDPSVLAPMPPILSQLIRSMLAKRREERPQSMGAVMSELQRCAVLRTNPWLRMMSEEPGEVRRPSGPIAVPAPLPPPLALPPLTEALEAVPLVSSLRQGAGEVQPWPPPTPRARPGRWPWMALGAALFCGVGIALASAMDWLPGSADDSGGRQEAKAETKQEVKSEDRTDSEPAVAERAKRAAAGSPLAVRAEPGAVTAHRDAASAAVAPVAGTESAMASAPRSALPPEMVVEGPGRIRMANPHRGRGDATMTLVEVHRFALSKYETTIGEYLLYTAANKLSPPTLLEGVSRDPEQPNLPMTLVNREQAASYCRWRYGQWAGRLPTEAEWEFAARDGRSERRYPWPGKALDEAKVNVGKGQLVPVRSLPEGTTDLGVLHTLGNAAEWVTSEGKKKGERAVGGTDWGVVRGGGADTPAKGLSAMTRTLLPAEGRYPFVGFRCAARAP